MTIIKDGTGKGNAAKVDTTKRLNTRAVNNTTAVEALEDGRSFFVSTGIVTLTSDCASQLLYIKNCDARDMFILNLIQVFGASTGGTGDYKSQLFIGSSVSVSSPPGSPPPVSPSSGISPGVLHTEEKSHNTVVS